MLNPKVTSLYKWASLTFMLPLFSCLNMCKIILSSLWTLPSHLTNLMQLAPMLFRFLEMSPNMKMSEHSWFQVPSWETSSIFPWEVGPAFIIYTKHDCVCGMNWDKATQTSGKAGRIGVGWALTGPEDVRCSTDQSPRND